MDAATQASSLLSGGNGNASDAVGRACRELSAVRELDPKLDALAAQLLDVDSLLSDVSRELGEYLTDADFDEARFRETEERLTVVNRLKEKYGGSVEAVQSALTEREEKIERLSDLDAFWEKTEAEMNEAEEKLQSCAAELSAARKAGAEKLCAEITDALSDLNFLDVRFTMEFTETADYTAEGKDDAQFLIAVNPGEPLLPLSSVASGGELSRVMLALKTVLAEQDKTPTMIFDEIDAGISGRTAQAVSEKLHTLAGERQIICITHLPQIAAMADTHFLIEKSVTDGNTVSTIRSLKEAESVEELSRLLGGAKVTDAVRENAREMKRLAKEK